MAAGSEKQRKLEFAAQKQTYSGKEAVHMCYCSMEAQMGASGSAVSLSALQPLKTWGWMLSDEQKAQMKQWIATVVGRMDRQGVIALEGGARLANSVSDLVATDMLQPISQSSGHASAPMVPKGKQQAKKEAKQAGSKANMMKFFVGKGKKTT